MWDVGGISGSKYAVLGFVFTNAGSFTTCVYKKKHDTLKRMRISLHFALLRVTEVRHLNKASPILKGPEQLRLSNKEMQLLSPSKNQAVFLCS